MEIDIKKKRQDAVIRLAGRLDVNTSPSLRKTAVTLYTRDHCKTLVIDFASISYIDTAGLATLLEILVMGKEQSAHLTLSNLSESVRYLIDINGLTGFFTIESPVQEESHA